MNESAVLAPRPQTVPTIGTTTTSPEADTALRPALLAQSWANQYPDMTGLVIILSRRRFPQRNTDVWFRTHFIVSAGQARRAQFGSGEEIHANGMCPHCGMVTTKPLLRRVLGIHPKAGEIIMPSATAGACVAKAGATYACEDCIARNGWRPTDLWKGDLKRAPLPELEIPNSKLKPILCSLPGNFAWYRDLPYYVEIDLMRGTIDVRKEFVA